MSLCTHMCLVQVAGKSEGTQVRSGMIREPGSLGPAWLCVYQGSSIHSLFNSLLPCLHCQPHFLDEKGVLGISSAWQGKEFMVGGPGAMLSGKTKFRTGSRAFVSVLFLIDFPYCRLHLQNWK